MVLLGNRESAIMFVPTISVGPKVGISSQPWLCPFGTSASACECRHCWYPFESVSVQTNRAADKDRGTTRSIWAYILYSTCRGSMNQARTTMVMITCPRMKYAAQGVNVGCHSLPFAQRTSCQSNWQFLGVSCWQQKIGHCKGEKLPHIMNLCVPQSHWHNQWIVKVRSCTKTEF